MDPLSLTLMLAPALVQGGVGIKQLFDAKKMQKNLGPRVGYEIPEAAKQSLGVAQRLASPYEMPGAGARRYSQDMQNQKFVAAALQAGNSQDAMAMLTQGLQSAQEGELAFSEASAQNYQQRQQNLQQSLGDYAGYQEKKRADEQQAWYEKADAAARMKGSAYENMFGGLEGVAQAGMIGMLYGGEGGGGRSGPTRQSMQLDVSQSENRVKNSLRNGLFKNNGPFKNAPALDPSIVSPSMPQASQGTFMPRGRVGKNPSMWDEYEPFVPQFGNWDYNGNNMSTWRQGIFNKIH